MQQKRNFGLDLARATAITMVLLAHGVSALAGLGVGVDLFFVLSGFLIGRIYLRAQADAHEPAGTFTLWSFWRARWFRTLPPYLAALGLYAVAQTRFHNNAVHADYLLFWQNYLGVDGFGPSWSLCVEEHFYLALPLVGWLVLRTLGRRSLPWLLPLLALVPMVWRTMLVCLGTLPVHWYWRSHLHAEGLIAGVWLAALYVDRQDLWAKLRRPAMVLSALPLLLMACPLVHPVPSKALEVTAFLLYAAGYTGWVRLAYDLAWSPATRLARLVESAVRGLALASYSIYLVHTLVFTDARVLLSAVPRGAIKTSGILGLGLAAGILFYFAVERPAILLRDRLLLPPPRRKPAALPVESEAC